MPTIAQVFAVRAFAADGTAIESVDRAFNALVLRVSRNRHGVIGR
ncbi:hypothetical protein [Yimella sp. NH-Cas1]|nr:hypothetical protein [Yimella sp. NH-Cas1]